MASGKYRITKIKRNWDGKTSPKYAVERIVQDARIKFIKRDTGEEVENEKLLEEYLKVTTEVLEKNGGKSDSYVFKLSQIKRSLQEDCMIIKNYDEKTYEQFKGKYEENHPGVQNLRVKKIRVDKKIVEKIVRDFYENEKEIIQKRIDVGDALNVSMYEIATKIFNEAKKCKEPEFKALQVAHINLKTIIDFQVNFAQQDSKGIRPQELIRQMFNSKRSDILCKYLIELYESEIKNEEERQAWFQIKGTKLLKQLHDDVIEYLGAKEKNTKYNFKGQRNRKEETLEKRLGISNTQIFDINKYYQNNDKNSAIRTFVSMNEIQQKTLIDEMLKMYDLSQLEKQINSIPMNLSENLKARKMEIQTIIIEVKKHYSETVHNDEITLKNEEKLVLHWIHQYVKGRYRKCRDLIMNNKTTIVDCKKCFEVKSLSSKIEKSIKNKVNTYKYFNGRKTKQNITSSFDLELLKANETFVSKIGTAVSKVGFTLNVQLYSQRMLQNHIKKRPDILSDPAKVIIVDNEVELGILRSQLDVFYNYYPEFNQQDELMKQLILFTQRLRHQVAHYQQTLDPLENSKIDENNRIEYYSKPSEEYRDFSKIKVYYENILDRMPEYLLEKYMTNNVFNIFRGNEEKIIKILEEIEISVSENKTVFPKFHRVFSKIKVMFPTMLFDISDDPKDCVIKEGAYKYLLQVVYYNMFQQKIKIGNKVLNDYKEMKIKELEKDGKKKNEAKKIVAASNIIVKEFQADIEKMYQNIQQAAAIDGRQQHYNHDWQTFIAVVFKNYIENNQVLNWLEPTVCQEFSKSYVLSDTYKVRVKNIFALKFKSQEIQVDLNATSNVIQGQEYKNSEEFTYSFLALASFLDLKEISHLRHDIMKYIQFISKLQKRSKQYEQYNQYIAVLKNIVNIYEILLEYKERCVQTAALANNYHKELEVLIDSAVLKNDINEITINIKAKNDTIIQQQLFKQNNIEETEDKWILLYGIEQAKKNGTFQFMREFMQKESFVMTSEMIDQYTILYNTKDQYTDVSNAFLTKYRNARKKHDFDKTNFLIENEQEYNHAIKANDNKIIFNYYTNLIHANILKLNYDFINDIFGHFMGWVQRLERDVTYDVVNVSNIRSKIAHFGYFKYTKMSLLDICNELYKEFSYNTKYQRDVQTVMNNIFEKYGVVATNSDGTKAPILKCKNEELKFAWEIDSSIEVGPKSHIYFPEFKLVHENQVEMLKRLFEYKK